MSELLNRLVVPSSLVAFVAYFSMALILVIKNRSNFTTILFSLWVLCWSIRNLGLFLMAQAPTLELAKAYSQIVYVPIAFLYVLFFHFTLEFTDQYTSLNKKLLRIAYVTSGFFLFTILFDFHWTKDPILTTWGYVSVVDIFAKIYTPFFFFYNIRSMIILHREYRGANDRYAKQAKTIFYSFLIINLAGVSTFMRVFGSSITPFTDLVGIMAALMITYSIFKYETFDLNFLRRRSLLFFVLVSLVTTFYILLVYGAGHLINPIFGDGNIFYVILSSAVLALTIRPLYSFLEKITNRFFHLEGLNQRELVSTISENLKKAVEDLDILIHSTTEQLCKSFRLQYVALFYFREGKEMPFKQKRTIYTLTQEQDQHSFSDRLQALIDFYQQYFGLEKNHVYLSSVIYQIQNEKIRSKKEKLRELRDHLEELNLTSFYFYRNRHESFCVLFFGKKLSGDDLSHEEEVLLSSLKTPIQIAIENYEFYELVIERQKQLNKIEKLALLGQMSQGLAHEIKNPLMSVKTFFETFSGLSIDDQKQFMNLAKDQLRRVEDLLARLKNYTQPQKLNCQTINLNDFLDRMYDFLKPEFIKKQVVFKKNIPENYIIYVDPSKFEQVILNLIQNSLQAIDKDKPDAWIKFTVDPNQSLMSLSDNGKGMHSDQLQKIFTPFYTTKKEGSGLGLSIVQNIIESHGGTITVDSTLGQGTVFNIKI